MVGRVDGHDVGTFGQEVAADHPHGPPVQLEDGEPAALGGDPESAVGLVVAQHVREVADLSTTVSVPASSLVVHTVLASGL